MSFIYELPTPAIVNFHHLLTDPTGSRTGQLAAANASRAAMRTTLKECKRSVGPINWVRVVRALEDYLPHLLGIMKSLEIDDILMPNEVVFSWRSTLSSRRRKSAPRISLSSFHFELASVLLTLAFAHSNTAETIIASIGQYELGSEVDRRAGDEKLTTAVDALCRASGIFDYLSSQTIPNWEASQPEGGRLLRQSRPPELSSEITAGLAKVSLADAERLAVRRLLSRSVMEHHTTPGAGLPKSHPSPGLLAKLQLNIHALYSGAFDSLSLVIPGSGANAEVAGAFRDYLRDGRQFSLGLGYKWLGIDAGEQSSRYAEAVGWLSLARESLKAVGGGGRTMVVVRNGAIKSERARRKGKTEHELDEVDRFMKAYEQINRTVTFEAVPSSGTLLSRVPGGRAALSSRTYTLPTALQRDFGSNYIPTSGDMAESDEEEDGGGGVDPQYALRDSYY
ncbi:hypothetical protein DFH28DRAFT_966506 [Melampsora americana]|nr:hypothetical protein DFH28DRAFT_966506 [Melampsora americana]